MKKKKRPNGFVARCVCGGVVGAMDFDRTEPKERNRILSEWLTTGCTIEPRWNGWSVTVDGCKCPED